MAAPDPIMAILDRHMISLAGREIIEELEAVLLSLFPDIEWDDDAKRWHNGDDYDTADPDWFNKAAEIPFRDEVHADVLHLLAIGSFRHNNYMQCNISGVTLRRLAKIGILYRLTWSSMPIATMLEFFELERRWMPVDSLRRDTLLRVCFGLSAEEDRIKLIQHLSGRFYGLDDDDGDIESFVDALYKRACQKCLANEISDALMQAVIDMWAHYHDITDQAKLYRLLGENVFSLTTMNLEDTVALTRLSRWADTSLLLLLETKYQIPHRPEMIAEWRVSWDADREWILDHSLKLPTRWARRWQRERAWRVMAMMVLLGGCTADGELRVSDAPVEPGFYRQRRQQVADRPKRFFRIAAQLPMELQETLAKCVIVVRGMIVTRLGAVPEYTWRWALRA